MDLHFTEHQPTVDEREAIDSLLGPPQSSWEGGSRTAGDQRFAVGGKQARDQRHQLLPALHALQSKIGWISHGGLNYLCRRLTIPPAEAYGVASFYALFSFEPQPPLVLHVCDDIACRSKGAEALCSALIAEPGVNPKSWKRSPCLGLCEHAPAAFAQVCGDQSETFSVCEINANTALDALRQEIPFHGPRAKVGARGPLLARVGIVDPKSLESYLSTGGYAALGRAVELGSSGVIEELLASKLSGRGGAAFPTGLKWKAVAESSADQKYIVCNADESEPGTFKDRVLMEGDPFAIIEAMTIAGITCRATRGFIYIRGEYPEAARSMQVAIDLARAAKLLGENAAGTGWAFDLEVRMGAGAYICGEETALLNSIEGKRGEPRNKPPFPVTHGLFGKPTVINNVETLVNIPLILRHGASDYSQTGSGNSTGTRLFCLSGCVQRPGVYEADYGTRLGDLIEAAGGLPEGRQLQAILLGGAAGVFVGPEILDMPLTLEAARERGVTLGSGVVMLFDDTIDLKDILLRIAAFFRDESCGQCVPCRVGAVRQEESLHRLFKHGSDAATEESLLEELDRVMRDASICGLGHTAASAVRSGLALLKRMQD